MRKPDLTPKVCDFAQLEPRLTQVARAGLTRRQFLGRTAVAGGLFALPSSRARVGPGPRRHGGPQRADRAGRHRRRRPRLGRPGLDDGREGRAVRGRLRRPEVAARKGQADGRRPLRQHRLQDLQRHARVSRDAARHRRPADRHRRPLARHGLDPGHAGRQGRLLREAVVHDDRRRSGRGRDRPAIRPRLPDRHAAAERGEFHLRQRTAAHRPAGQGPHGPRPHRPVGRGRDDATTGCRPSPSRPRTRWIGTSGSAPAPGGRTTRATSAAAGAASTISTPVASANGAPTRSPSARWPSAPPTPRRSSTTTSTIRRATAWSRASPTGSRWSCTAATSGGTAPAACATRAPRAGWPIADGYAQPEVSSPALLADFGQAGGRLHGPDRAPDEPRARLLRLHQVAPARPWPTR